LPLRGGGGGGPKNLFRRKGCQCTWKKGGYTANFTNEGEKKLNTFVRKKGGAPRQRKRPEVHFARGGEKEKKGFVCHKRRKKTPFEKKNSFRLGSKKKGGKKEKRGGSTPPSLMKKGKNCRGGFKGGGKGGFSRISGGGGGGEKTLILLKRKRTSYYGGRRGKRKKD